MFKSAFDFKVVPLTSHVWQQSSSQENSRTQISDSNVASSEETAQKGSGDDQRTESWHFLPQEIDSSHTSDTSQTRFNVREEETDVADFLSVEEGVLTQSENQVKKHNRGLFCSPLLVIQDNFASPDLPLLTCLTQDQEIGPDSIFHQSGLDFAPLRGIPGKSEDIEGFSRPAEVSEALFQATSEVASDLVNSRFNVSQHTLTGSTDVESQGSFLHPEQETKEETVLTYTVDELKKPKDSDSYGALCSYMSWKIQEVTQKPETNLADKDQFSFSTSSDISDKYVTPKESDSFDASCSDVHYWKREALQQSEKYLTKKAGSSNIIYPLEVSTSDSLFSQDLKQQTFEEVADSSNDILEGLQRKAESDIYSLGDDIECCSLDENAVVCSERSAELQREICDQGDLTGKCIELAGLENMLDDLEICDVSLPWQSALQLPSEEEPDISRSFSSVLPPFVPHEPTRELEYHSSDLRMLRVSPEIMPKTLKHLPGDISKGGISEITQSNLKADITTTSGDSGIGSHLPLSSEDFSQLAVRSSVENTLNQQRLANGHVTEETLQALAVPKLADQQAGISTVPFSSYSQREKPNIFYPQALRDSHQIEEALRVSAVIGPVDQKSEKTTVPSSSYTHREKHNVFSQPLLPDSLPTEQALNGPFVPGPADQVTVIPTVSSTLYSHGEKPYIFYQQTLPESNLTEQSQQAAAISGFAGQKTGIPTGTSTSYSHREKPHIFYQQTFPENHLTEQAVKVSVAPGSTEQKTGIPIVSSAYSHREKPSIFYQQELPVSHPTEQSQQAATLSGFADQKTGTSTSYSHGEKPHILYQQTLPESQLTEQSQQAAAVYRFADQKARIPTGTSTYSHGETSFFYQQRLPDSQLTEQAQKISSIPGQTDQNTGIQTGPSSAYSHREKPIIFYQQEFPDSNLTEEALKVSSVPGPGEQNTGIPPGSSGFYSFEEKSSTFYQQALADSHPTEETLKVSTISGPSDQKPGIQTLPSTSYPHREKHIIISPQALPDSHLLEEALKVSTVSRPAEQKTGLPSEPPTSYSHREKPVFYPQGLTESHLFEEALKVSAVSGPADQKTGLPSEPPTSYSHREKPIFYQQGLSDSHLTEKALKVSAVPGTGDQKPGIPTVPPSSYSPGGKSIIFYQQALPDRHLTEEALNVSTSGPADQKTGLPTVSSTSYSHRENPIISYQQDLTKEALEILGVSGPAEQKTGIPVVTSISYSPGEKPIISYQQELPDHNEEASKLLAIPGSVDQKTGVRIVPSSYSYREGPIISYQDLPDITEKTLEVSAVPGPTDQKTGIGIIPSGSPSYREKGNIFYQQDLPDITEEALKVFALPGPVDQKTEIPEGSSSSYSHKEKPRISTVILPDDQKTEFPTAPLISYAQIEKPKNLAVIEPNGQQTPLLTVFRNSYSQRVTPSIFFKQHLPTRQHSEDIQKISSVPESTDVNSRVPIPLPSSYSHREKSNIVCPQELSDKHLTEDVLTVSTIPKPADQKTVLPTAPPHFFSHREKQNKFCEQNLPDRHLTKDALKFSSGLRQADQITGLSAVYPDTYSHSEKHKFLSDHVQRPKDHLDSSNSSIISNNMPLNSQADGRVVINKPEPSGFEDIGSEEFQGTDNGSKTLKEIRTLLMEAENIALKRCNFPAPLVPFRDVNDVSFIQSKKVVCFKEPPTTDKSNIDLPQRQSFTKENPNKYLQKDISTQTNLKCQGDIENWEFVSSTTVRSPLQEAEIKARMALDETLRQYKAARPVMRSEPEGCSGTLGNKILIPMMTIIKSDSSSDASSCSWDSNSFESVSDVLLNLFPCTSPKTSMTDSREEECLSESDEGRGSSVDSLAAHVKNLLKCESSLNHAKQILRNAEEEECRVRARAWNLKFNMARECGYSISELNEDDRRKVEEIKAKLFGHERTDLSKGLRSPQGIRCHPKAVCGHIIIESHEKGCFRTLTPKQSQLDSHPCIFRSPEPLEIIRGHRSPSSWRSRHINLSKSLDQSNTRFKVWNSLQLQSRSPIQNFTTDDFKISKGFRMPFRENMDPWLSELVEPTYVLPEEMDCHSSSQMLSPESMKKFTTSITFSSHRHSKCFSDSSVLKVGVTEDSQYTRASVTPNSPPIFFEQPEFCKVPHADHYIRKPPPSHQHYVAPNLPCHIFLENRELFEQSKTPQVDHQMRINHSPLPQGQSYIAPDLPSSIFLEQRQLFEQSRDPDIDHQMRKQYSPLPQGQDYVVENKDQQEPKSYISNIKVETNKINDVVSQSSPNQYTLVTSPSTPPSNKKILSFVRITLSPKTSSKLDSGTLDKRFLSLDSASKTRMNSEFNSDLQTISSRSLEPTSKLLTGKLIVHDQESLGSLGPKSSPDFQVIQSFPDSNIISQDLKTIPFQNSQIVTSKQTQVNFSDLEEYSNPERTPVSADRSLGKVKIPLSASSRKLLSDAVTQITTESPGKAMFSSQIFINADDGEREIPEPSSQKLDKAPNKFASSSSVQQIAVPRDIHGAQPSLLPYKPPGSTKMYYVPQLSQSPSSMDSKSKRTYVPQLGQIPSPMDSKSDTTIESSHSGSNDAIAPDFPAQVLGTRDDDLKFSVHIKHKEGIYSKRAVTKPSSSKEKKNIQKDNADVQVLITGNENHSDKKQKKKIYTKKSVTKPAQPEKIEFLQKDTGDSIDAVAAELAAQLQDTKIESLPDTKAIKQKEAIPSKRTFPKEACSENKESLQIDIEESSSEFENTTHSVFRSAKFYFHHPVHLPSDRDFCHESLGRSVFMGHSWKDFFQHHPDKHHISLPSSYQTEEKTECTRIESLHINVNLGNKEMIHSTKSQAGDYTKCDKQINDQKKNRKVTPEPTTQHITSLNELWNKYQERQKQQKSHEFRGGKELSLVERLDRLAKLLQNPITHSLWPSESTQDDSRGQRDTKEWNGRQQQRNKLQKKKRYKSVGKCHKNIDLKNKVLSTHQAGRSNQIKIEQLKFDKYILRKQPNFCSINNTSSDSRPSEESELLTDPAISTTTSPVESDILTQTDKEVTLHERSSSLSTIDTARLIQAFGHERVCLSPRRVKLYSSITDHQRRYIEKQSKNKKKALSHPQMTSEHTRKKHIQVVNRMISSDSVSSSTGNFWSSNSTLCDKQNVHTLNKGVQAGNLEIVNGLKKNTRDVGVIFPTPSLSEVKVEEDSDVTSWSEEKVEEKKLLTRNLGDKKLKKNKQSCCEEVSWFVPVENVKSGPKKENFNHRGPGIAWFAPITNTKPWREPLREQNWQGQHTASHTSLAGPGRSPLKPLVKATLQESLLFHRPDFISRSGERIKRLKLIVQERKLQNVLQSEREMLFNTGREWQGQGDSVHLFSKRGFLAAQKYKPVGKKEMIQRSKRIYEQLPEVQKKREEERRRLEYKSYRLRAQLYKKKVTNQLLGRKVPWD
ncbi:PREDICTED: Alstrom syndrome protein 1 [Myotis brandtii]|uniref:Alstrom syndrome protein 1 n=1 Tax=Myotis brandtii TaxID=109478 RepID=UPI00070475BD|nr:PREDICTED: Alstrom syndrome protein 1 [Myotis brandtii]